MTYFGMPKPDLKRPVVDPEKIKQKAAKRRKTEREKVERERENLKKKVMSSRDQIMEELYLNNPMRVDRNGTGILYDAHYKDVMDKEMDIEVDALNLYLVYKTELWWVVYRDMKDKFGYYANVRYA